jgi:hypothetical protein
MKPLDDKIPKL